MHNGLTQILEYICTLHDNLAEFMNRYNGQALPNSLADVELHQFSRAESLITAYSQGGTLIEVAADQLMAITKTLTEPAQAIAPWTCLRAIIESCALGSWLLSPNIEAKIRVQRSLAFRYEGLSEQLKFWNAASVDKATMNMVATRIDDVENLANNLGFPRVLNRKGKRIGIGQEMPPVTILVQSELNEESLYRLLSAMVHDYLWALQQLGFHQVNNDNYRFINGSDSNLKIHALEKKLDFNLIVFLCHKAVINFVKPVWCQCQLFGWEQDHLKVLFENAFNSLGIRDDNKFWKSSNIKTG